MGIIQWMDGVCWWVLVHHDQTTIFLFNPD
jgi:hypothetical protein